MYQKKEKKMYARIFIPAWKWARWSSVDHGIMWCNISCNASIDHVSHERSSSWVMGLDGYGGVLGLFAVNFFWQAAVNGQSFLDRDLVLWRESIV